MVGHGQRLWDAEPRRILSPACGPMDPKTMHVHNLRLRELCDQACPCWEAFSASMIRRGR